MAGKPSPSDVKEALDRVLEGELDPGDEDEDPKDELPPPEAAADEAGQEEEHGETSGHSSSHNSSDTSSSSQSSSSSGSSSGKGKKKCKKEATKKKKKKKHKDKKKTKKKTATGKKDEKHARKKEPDTPAEAKGKAKAKAKTKEPKAKPAAPGYLFQACFCLCSRLLSKTKLICVLLAFSEVLTRRRNPSPLTRQMLKGRFDRNISMFHWRPPPKGARSEQTFKEGRSVQLAVSREIVCLARVGFAWQCASASFLLLSRYKTDIGPHRHTCWGEPQGVTATLLEAIAIMYLGT